MYVYPPALIRLGSLFFRYALDVNVERAEDVLMHQRLLHSALDPNNRPVIQVRLVQVSLLFVIFIYFYCFASVTHLFLKVQPPTGNISADSTALDSLTTNEPDQASTRKRLSFDPHNDNQSVLDSLSLIFYFFIFFSSIHPPPAFGSSPNLEALALASTISHDEEEGDSSVPNNSRYV